VLTLAATRTGAAPGATIYSVSLDFTSDSEGGPVIAGRIEQRDGKLYAMQPARTEQRATV
jgi:hypothetical protein